MSAAADDECLTTVDQLQYCFRESGIDVEGACTATSESASVPTAGHCWVVGSLALWNKFLHSNGIELLEHLPNRLMLRNFVSYPRRNRDHHAVGAYLVSKLISDHHCVHSVQLNCLGTIFSSETEVFDDVRFNRAIENITLNGEWGLYHKSRLKSSKFVGDLVGSNPCAIRIYFISLFSTPRKRLCEVLATSSRLVELSLGHNGLTPEGTFDILNSIKASTTLSSLSVTNNNISLWGASCIAEVLKTTTTLESLILSNAHIGSEGATVIAKALEANKTVKVLKLGCNDIMVAGVSELCKALKANSTLLVLDLQRNYFRDDGAVHVAEMLTCNNTLQELDVRWTEFQDTGMTAIADALTTNRSLVCMSIELTRVSGECIDVLVRAFETNNTLTRLYLGDLLRCMNRSQFRDVLALNRPLVQLETALYATHVAELSQIVRLHRTLRHLSVCDCALDGTVDMTLLFSALEDNRTVRELNVVGVKGVNQIESLASLIATTTTIRSVSVSGVYSHDGLATLMRGLSHNKSIYTYHCGVRNLTMSCCRAIYAMLTNNSTLSHLSFNDVVASEKCLTTLAKAMGSNLSLLQLGVSYRTGSSASFSILECLRKNSSVVTRAMEFALTKSAERTSAEAFETYRKNDLFIEKLSLFVGARSKAETLIAEANIHIRDHFFFFTKIVKERLVCFPSSERECQTGIDRLNGYCLREIISYLEIRDVKV